MKKTVKAWGLFNVFGLLLDVYLLRRDAIRSRIWPGWEVRKIELTYDDGKAKGGAE